MDITRRCDYACRILRAAYKSGDEYVSVSEIAEKEDIPYAFARSIQHDLVKAGLIRTVRGARGGLSARGGRAARGGGVRRGLHERAGHGARRSALTFFRGGA